MLKRRGIRWEPNESGGKQSRRSRNEWLLRVFGLGTSNINTIMYNYCYANSRDMVRHLLPANIHLCCINTIISINNGQLPRRATPANRLNWSIQRRQCVCHSSTTDRTCYPLSAFCHSIAARSAADYDFWCLRA